MKMLSTLAVGLVGLTAAFAASAQDKSPITLTVTGAGSTGSFAVIVEGFNAIYREAYPGSTVSFQPNSVGGGMVAVAGGKADVSIGLPPVEARRGYNGEEPFKEPLKGKIFHVMTLLPETDFVFVANKEWANKHGIKTMEDLVRVKPPVRLGASSLATLYLHTAVEDILKHYGASHDDIPKWGGKVFHNPAGTNIQDLRDGKLDLIVPAGPAPNRGVAEVHKNLPLVWIETDKAVLEKIAAPLDILVVQQPASYYEFTDKDVWNLRAPVRTAAGAHVPAETVYKILKAIDENIERVRAIHPTFKDFSVAKMAVPSPVLPYHPGAEKFYREKGLLK